MKIDFQPKAEGEHPEAEFFSTDGSLSRETDDVIAELNRLMQGARQEMTSELDGNITFCLRELAVYAHGRVQGRANMRDPERVETVGKIRRALANPELRDLGIVEPEERIEDEIVLSFDDMVSVLSGALGISVESLVKAFEKSYAIGITLSTARRTNWRIGVEKQDDCYVICNKSGECFRIRLDDSVKTLDRESGEMVETIVPIVEDLPWERKPMGMRVRGARNFL